MDLRRSGGLLCGPVVGTRYCEVSKQEASKATLLRKIASNRKCSEQRDPNPRPVRCDTHQKEQAALSLEALRPLSGGGFEQRPRLASRSPSTRKRVVNCFRRVTRKKTRRINRDEHFRQQKFPALDFDEEAVGAHELMVGLIQLPSTDTARLSAK
ncbi:hypothetical protein AVEN_71015-1 [Araneus ventricosus]|uniref:Uncharacterized protein n=1 Tax=Araneus ventricosus TaxID=182803 RepID=A0A4Y2PYD1_ARAVE|nr:hypothetical protein AVEN_71015-1 [Araneus ventricosus]